MKLRNMILGLLFCASSSLIAQTYTFTATTGTYNNLSQSTSLNQGMTWDDPVFTIPIGFNFKFFNKTLTTIDISDYGLGGLLADDNNADIVSFLVPYGADIIDRGYDLFQGSTNTSQSNISYKLEGTAGNRILKIEWNNAGFFNDLDDNNVSVDYVNFQLWLYEGSNTIEVRFGPNSVSQPELVFEGGTGSWVGIISEYNANTNTLRGEAYILEGRASAPTMKAITDPSEIATLNGVEPNGTIYRFERTTTGIDDHHVEIAFNLFPNPARDKVNIIMNDEDVAIESVSVLDVKGSLVFSSTNSETIDISSLNAGMYFVELRTNKGIGTKMLVKQ